VLELTRQVVLRDMRDFVAQHRGEFVLGFRGQDETTVHADVAAGAGKGVQRRVDHHEKAETRPRIAGAARQALAEAIDIADYQRVIQHWHRLAYLAHEGDADALLKLCRQETAARVAHFGQCNLRLRGGQAQTQQQTHKATQHGGHGSVATGID
jgi:hypothetical protein